MRVKLHEGLDLPIPGEPRQVSDRARAALKSDGADDRVLVWVARLSSGAIRLLALAILPNLSSIQRAWHTSLLRGVGGGVILLLRWIWWRVTPWSELTALGASTLLAPLLLWAFPVEQEAARLLWMAIGATTAGVVVALVGPAESMTQLACFYRRVRPPGFWRPVAEVCGSEERVGQGHLALGLAATVADEHRETVTGAAHVQERPHVLTRRSSSEGGGGRPWRTIRYDGPRNRLDDVTRFMRKETHSGKGFGRILAESNTGLGGSPCCPLPRFVRSPA